MDLPEDSPAAFSLFFEWLNLGTTEGVRFVPFSGRAEPQRYLVNLFDLYIFAEKFV
jgi:hypothetical protein